MKKLYILLLMIITCSFISFAGPHDGKKKEDKFKEMQEFKMKYLAQEMELKENQKQKFFKLYSEMSEEKKDCFKKAKELERSLKDNKNASEEDYQKVTEEMNKAKARSAEIEKEYDAKFSEFLTQKQIFKMKEAEAEFRKKMQEMKNKRPHGKLGKKGN